MPTQIQVTLYELGLRVMQALDAYPDFRNYDTPLNEAFRQATLHRLSSVFERLTLAGGVAANIAQRGRQILHDANEALCTQTENRYREVAVHLRALHDVLHEDIGNIYRFSTDDGRWFLLGLEIADGSGTERTEGKPFIDRDRSVGEQENSGDVGQTMGRNCEGDGEGNARDACDPEGEGPRPARSQRTRPVPRPVPYLQFNNPRPAAWTWRHVPRLEKLLRELREDAKALFPTWDSLRQEDWDRFPGLPMSLWSWCALEVGLLGLRGRVKEDAGAATPRRGPDGRPDPALPERGHLTHAAREETQEPVPDERQGAIGHSAEVESPNRQAANRLSVDVEQRMAWLDGRHYPLRSEGAARFLKQLAEHPGAWISSTEMGNNDPMLEGTRLGRLSVPKPIRDRIQSSSGRGYRFMP